MPTTAVLVQDCDGPITSSPSFSVSLVQNVADLEECQRLRYQVFNRELGEGLAASERTGLDRRVGLDRRTGQNDKGRLTRPRRFSPRLAPL